MPGPATRTGRSAASCRSLQRLFYHLQDMWRCSGLPVLAGCFLVTSSSEWAGSALGALGLNTPATLVSPTEQRTQRPQPDQRGRKGLANRSKGVWQAQLTYRPAPTRCPLSGSVGLPARPGPRARAIFRRVWTEDRNRATAGHSTCRRAHSEMRAVLLVIALAAVLPALCAGKLG